MSMPGQRNPRLSIPRVDPNPGHPRTGVGPGAAGALKSPATSTAQASNTVPETQSTPTDPFHTAGGSAAPAPVPTPSSTPLFPVAASGDPRDKTYWANVAKLKFTDEQEYSKGLREQTRADTDYGDAFQTAIRNRGVQQRELGENAIRGNLGASGWLDRNEGEQTTAYTQDRSHASRNKEEEDQARLAAREAIRQGFLTDTLGLDAEYGERVSQRAREEAQNNPPAHVGASEEVATSAGGGKSSAPKIGIGKAKALRPAKRSDGGNGDGGTTAPSNPVKQALRKKTR